MRKIPEGTEAHVTFDEKGAVVALDGEWAQYMADIVFIELQRAIHVKALDEKRLRNMAEKATRALNKGQDNAGTGSDGDDGADADDGSDAGDADDGDTGADSGGTVEGPASEGGGVGDGEGELVGVGG